MRARKAGGRVVLCESLCAEWSVSDESLFGGSGSAVAIGRKQVLLLSLCVVGF